MGGPSTGSGTDIGPRGGVGRPFDGLRDRRREIPGRWFDKLTIRPDRPFDKLRDRR